MVAPANFELASGAITTARAALDTLDWDEDTTRLAELWIEWFYCKMCAHGVCRMKFEDLVSTYSTSVFGWNPLGRPHTCNSSATARGTPHNPSRIQAISTTSPTTKNQPSDSARPRSSSRASTTARSCGTSLPAHIAGFAILRPKRGPRRRGSRWRTQSAWTSTAYSLIWR